MAFARNPVNLHAGMPRGHLRQRPIQAGVTASVLRTPEGMVPVIYRVDLMDPRSFFVMQSFPVSHKDRLYVSNAPIAELQKFLNVVFSVAYPVLTAVQVTN